MVSLPALQTSGAAFSPDRRFRFGLYRDLPVVSAGRALFIGLNPSTADERVNDPTIRRCMGFAQREHAGGFYMANVSPWRSTDPSGLKDPDAFTRQDENLEWIKAMALDSQLIVCAWGAHLAWLKRSGETDRIVEELTDLGVPLQCLRKTKWGAPGHPLYIPGDKQLEAYP